MTDQAEIIRLRQQVETLEAQLEAIKRRGIPEFYFDTTATGLLLHMHPKTVVERLQNQDFGFGVLDLCKQSRSDAPKKPNYRIPASGIVAFSSVRRIFLSPEELGISARSPGELVRKEQNKQER